MVTLFKYKVDIKKLWCCKPLILLNLNVPLLTSVKWKNRRFYVQPQFDDIFVNIGEHGKKSNRKWRHRADWRRRQKWERNQVVNFSYIFRATFMKIILLTKITASTNCNHIKG